MVRHSADLFNLGREIHVHHRADVPSSAFPVGWGGLPLFYSSVDTRWHLRKGLVYPCATMWTRIGTPEIPGRVAHQIPLTDHDLPMDETINTRVPAEVKRAAEAEAMKAGMTVSEWLRYQIRKLTDTEPRVLSEMDHPEEEKGAASA